MLYSRFSLVIYFICACVCPKSLQLCPTLCDPTGCNTPGSSVHGILQARILEWVAMPAFQGIFLTQWSNPCLSCLLHWQAGSLPAAPPGNPILYIAVDVCQPQSSNSSHPFCPTWYSYVCSLQLCLYFCLANMFIMFTA